MTADPGGAREGTWLGELRALVDAGVLTGYALVTVKGVYQPVVGPLSATLNADAPACPSEQLLDIVRTFGSCKDGPDAFDLLGQRLQVVHRSPSSVFALGRRRELGVGAAQLPLGVLIATFGRGTPLPVAVAAVEAAARWPRA
mmetsp:Transcript_36482/g.107745  ORF Transcript_36482/g.107745 Transcript_36482/m.107745 type:complete len:143 (-) Transcript_36482:182-610(-)